MSLMGRHGPLRPAAVLALKRLHTQTWTGRVQSQVFREIIDKLGL